MPSECLTCSALLCSSFVSNANAIEKIDFFLVTRSTETSDLLWDHELLNQQFDQRHEREIH